MSLLRAYQTRLKLCFLPAFLLFPFAFSLHGFAETTPARTQVFVHLREGCQAGRLLVIFSKRHGTEPRWTTDPTYESQQIFGIDVHEMKPGSTIALDDTAVGYPVSHLSQLPEGEYQLQAVLNVYEQYKLATGTSVWLPPDRGEGQHWSQKPGNLVSVAADLHLDPLHPSVVHLALDHRLPPVQATPDTPYVRHVTIHSKLLSGFWGRDVTIGAIVLLPPGWKEHPSARYPVLVWQDHYSAQFNAGSGFRETPPESPLGSDARKEEERAYRFYLDWNAGRLPHVLIVQPLHANPYYDDSYAVNSANLGPYGDAITQELIPEVEAQFHGIGEGWARMTAGGSTGGWAALASQIFYPDFYNGTYAMCPDPVDFHAFGVTNLYEDSNAYHRSGTFTSVPIPALRSGDGDVIATMEGANRYELAIANHGRSAEQYDIWQAVFSPAGKDGYPQPVFNKETGAIDSEVVQYWQQHYDLTAILHRDWPMLGPKLEGKLHLTAGESDSFYLNNAVHRMQNVLNKTTNPHSDASFDYGSRQPHCYTGSQPDWANKADLNPLMRILPLLVDHVRATSPKGADLTSWVY